MQLDVRWQALLADGDAVASGEAIARLEGSARDLLTGERVLLNFVGQLSGIATLTRQYIEAIRGTAASIYDTRKTTPGWRRLEKYAVRCGGGTNHRTGLFDAILIKDNHLAQSPARTPAEALMTARAFLRQQLAEREVEAMIVEIEVDSLAQFAQVLPHAPDIILLDNMTNEQLRAAVEQRNQSALAVQLEASGGVNLSTVRGIAETGVERFSVGALTHSAACLDVGLDWQTI
jgi:nicotinate-nucleotide pyrophosphorylase (carboxylating)